MPRGDNKGKLAPMSYEDMLTEGGAKKANSSLYKAENMALQDDRISSIISKTTEELIELAKTDEHINLRETNRVKERTLLYFRACNDTSSLPSFSGLLRSMGLTASAGYNFMRVHPEHATSEWLLIAHDAMADMLAESANRGLTNTIFSIFLEKARFGWRDTVAVEMTSITDLASENRDREVTAQELMAKYCDMPDD